MSSAKIRQRSARKANRVRWNRYRAQRKLDGWTPIKERERLAEMNRTRVRNFRSRQAAEKRKKVA